MIVNADISPSLLKADTSQRGELMASLPRLTLLLEEKGSSGGDQSQLRESAEHAFQAAYEGLSGPGLAHMVIGLKYSDYHQQLASMLGTIQDALSANPHYLGWAWHSYNDAVQGL